ncbi:NUDIX domain-containing protein [Sphingobacterium thalpophilum]|uniref:NUDIX domain-containing protein n=1 Tax=Sphingobacterium thalpophilum TaxID=259 RepID=A0ACD5C5N7_9SPHI
MLQVTCAIIEHANKILICQRSASMKLPLKWEFPGGKIETGESKEECLRREIKEELQIDISIHSALTMVECRFRINWFFINFGESTINNYTLDIRPSFFSKIIPTLASKL